MVDNFSSVTPEIEIVNNTFPRGPFRAAIFDFDGTLSLIRRNWHETMIPMMVDVLQQTGTSETPESLYQQVEEFVMRLNGRQTIYQMMELAEQVKRRGAVPKEPLDYKHQYHDLLWQHVEQRIDSIRAGQSTAEEWTIPGSKELLGELRQFGLDLYLASGTDLKYVRDEVALLELQSYFGERIHGALDDYKKFSKAMIIAQIIQETKVPGSQIVGFGDGYVEIEEIKKVGGLAIGVASEETTRQGINAWKRERLIRAGADIVIGDYRQRADLLNIIGVERILPS